MELRRSITRKRARSSTPNRDECNLPMSTSQEKSAKLDNFPRPPLFSYCFCSSLFLIFTQSLFGSTTGMKGANPRGFSETAADEPSEESHQYVVDKDLERIVLRKFDLHVLPLLALMYLFKYETVTFYFSRTLLTSSAVQSTKAISGTPKQMA
jgi:hypothetical protein